MRKALAVFALSALAVVASPFVSSAHAGDDTPELTKKEKKAKSWTPKIEDNFVRSVNAQQAKLDSGNTFTVDAQCLLDGIEEAWSSPGAFYKASKKNKKVVERAVSGISLACLKTGE